MDAKQFPGCIFINFNYGKEIFFIGVIVIQVDRILIDQWKHCISAIQLDSSKGQKMLTKTKTLYYYKLFFEYIQQNLLMKNAKLMVSANQINA